MESSTQSPDRSYLPFRGVENDDRVFLPLDLDLREIRCVVLLPGSGDDPIACELVYTNINEHSDSRIPYVALSYCWGAVDDTVEILLHGPSTDSAGAYQEPTSAPFRVTRNLYIALQALRNDTRQYLWIDALCINQQDLQEKTQQVQLMSKIYSLAQSVLVWLGPEDESSRFLMRMWHAHLGPLIGNQYDNVEYPGDYGGINKSTHTLWTTIEQDQTLSQLADDLYNGRMDDTSPDRYKRALFVSFNNLLNRPWWGRIWILQEVFLAPKCENGNIKVDVRVGHSRLQWRELKHLKESVDLITFKVSDDRSLGFSHSWNEIQYHWWKVFIEYADRNKYRDTWSREQDIENLLESTIGFHASDPRDRIFALLLLASDTKDCFSQEPLLRPDYTKSYHDVFDDLVRWKPSIESNRPIICTWRPPEHIRNSKWPIIGR